MYVFLLKNMLIFSATFTSSQQWNVLYVAVVWVQVISLFFLAEHLNSHIFHLPSVCLFVLSSRRATLKANVFRFQLTSMRHDQSTDSPASSSSFALPQPLIIVKKGSQSNGLLLIADCVCVLRLHQQYEDALARGSRHENPIIKERITIHTMHSLLSANCKFLLTEAGGKHLSI